MITFFRVRWLGYRLYSKRSATRKRAAQALGRIRNGVAARVLAQALENPPRELVSDGDNSASFPETRHIVDALVDMGATASGSVINVLSSRSKLARLCAIRVLTRLNCRNASAHIADLLLDRFKKVRNEAANSVAGLHWEPQTAPHRIAVAFHRNDVDGAVSEVAEGLDTLNIMLTEGDRDLIEFAAKALGRSGDPRAVEPLIRVLQQSDFSGREAFYARGALVEALGNLGDERAIEHLSAVLVDTCSGDESGAAAEALGKIGDARAVPYLVQAIGNEVARGYAKRALAKIADTGAMERLLALLTGQPNERIRANVAWVLGRLNDRRALQPLLEMLNDLESEVHEAVRGSLDCLDPGWRETPEATRKAHDWAGILTNRIHEPDLQRAAARSLGVIGSMEAIQAAAFGLDNGDWIVQCAAANALRLNLAHNDPRIGTFANHRLSQYATQVWPQVAKLLVSSVVCDRERAALIVGAIGKPASQAIPLLVTNLNHPDLSSWRAIRASAEAIVSMGEWSRVIPVLSKWICHERFISIATVASNREEAVDILVQIGREAVPAISECLVSLCRLSKTKDGWLKSHIIEALVQMDADDELTHTVLRRCLGCESTVQNKAVKALNVLWDEQFQSKPCSKNYSVLWSEQFQSEPFFVGEESRAEWGWD